MIGVGFIVSTWVGYGSHHVPETSSFSWRFPLAFQALPAALLAVGMFWFPESPRHLIATDRLEEGRAVLHKLHYDGSNDEWVQNEFNEIKTTIDAEKSLTVPGWSVMFTVPQWRRRLILATLVQVFTQFTGINVINYYQTIMYKSLGITGKRSLLVAGIYNCMGPLASKSQVLPCTLPHGLFALTRAIYRLGLYLLHSRPRRSQEAPNLRHHRNRNRARL